MPLPEIQYQPTDFSRGTVQKNSHVYLGKDKHYYSVPFTYFGKKVLLMNSNNVVEIYNEQRRIAFDDRVYSKYGCTTKKEQMPLSYQYMSEWNPNRFISWARNIGEKIIADAILYKMVHNSLRIELKGESLRKKNTISEKKTKNETITPLF